MNGKTLLDVAVPCLASGRVSGHDLERYASWVRGIDVAAVLLWSPTAQGAAYEVEEREEILSVWRAGLSPSQKIIVALPVGGRDVPESEVLFQAIHARECGADALAVLAAPYAFSKDVIKPLTSPGFDLPVYQIQEQHVVSLLAEADDRFILRVWPDPQIDTELRALASQTKVPIGQLLLGKLADKGVIETTGNSIFSSAFDSAP